MSSRSRRITEIIQSQFDPVYLFIENESHRHHVPENAETHFKILLVSKFFEHQSRIKRHRMVHNALESELQNGLHALSLHLYTPDEWDIRKIMDAPYSPQCRGGFHNEQK